MSSYCADCCLHRLSRTVTHAINLIKTLFRISSKWTPFIRFPICGPTNNYARSRHLASLTCMWENLSLKLLNPSVFVEWDNKFLHLMWSGARKRYWEQLGVFVSRDERSFAFVFFIKHWRHVQSFLMKLASLAWLSGIKSLLNYFTAT